MKKSIYFDMDGTIAGLYQVQNWLSYLEREQTKPYREAKPMLDMRALGKEIKRVQSLGYAVGIISWLSKESSLEYEKKVIKAKKDWLARHLGSITFDEIHIVSYGTEKSTCGSGILFDDEQRNRKEWASSNGLNLAFGPENILEILKKIY